MLKFLNYTALRSLCVLNHSCGAWWPIATLSSSLNSQLKFKHEFEFKLQFEFVLCIMGVDCTELALYLTMIGQDGGEGLILLWRLM